MIRFGIKNIRRLKDVEPVALKPITVLVGRNSSGKSTFLRSFPLLRQSLVTRTSSPLLWYGDLVDLGSFQDVVTDKKGDSIIELRFSLDDVTVQSQYYYGIDFAYFTTDTSTTLRNINMTSYISGHQNKTRLHGFKLSFGDQPVTFEVDLNEVGGLSRFCLNGKRIEYLFKDSSVTFKTGTLFPDVYIRSLDTKNVASSIGFAVSRRPLHNAMVSILTPHLDKRMRKEVVERVSFELLGLAEFTDLELERLQSRTNVRSFAKIIKDIRGKNSKGLREEVQTIILAGKFSEISSSVFQKLRNIFAGTLYIGPVRARSERYYRYQELAVSEIDPDGKNFPMFLNSLSERLRKSFSNWVQERFGYGVSVSPLEGHISINLLTDDGSSTNIVDAGFGISQVLPVLGQIWWASVGSQSRPAVGQSNDSRILAIEQPELHLHPAHQALLADAIAAERARRPSDMQKDLSFLIETHSEAFVNRLGELISSKRIDAQDVHILVFENDLEDESRTNVRVAEFGEDGSLINWPYGFFQPVPHYDN